jgi:two-component system, sensor histidine kinase and response regulator
MPSILIIDDEIENFDVIEILLFKEGYELSYAKDGLTGLKYLETHKPDVILLDVMMPDFDGIEVCCRIKANAEWNHIPVIMVTALNSKEDLSRCLDAGADDFVGKPVNGLELRSRVRSMLRIKQQYDQLATLLKIQEETLQLREDMSSMVIHDLRNPLTTMMLATQVLKLHPLTEKQQEKVEQIEYTGNRLQCLVDSFLTMAKLESGHLRLNLSEVDFCDLGKTAIDDFQAIALQQMIDLVSDLPAPGNRFNMDAVLIRRVLDNLLSNALKFSPANSQVMLSIEYPSEHQVRIQVKDMGRGVSEDLQQRIFEKYDIGKIAEGVNQIGLGLAFCKMAIEAHSGSISVSANHPKGSIFTVDLAFSS